MATDTISGLTTISPADLPQVETFAELGLSEAVLAGIRDAGYVKPLEVQVATAKVALEGRDLVVRSKTGSGKTLAFAAPILSRIDYTSRKPQVLVLAPTRELALQVHGEFEKISRHTGLRSIPIYGGTGFGKQLDALRDGVQLVVGTPGRVLDHHSRGTLDLRHVKTFVLDEADEMLSAGFYEDIIQVFDTLETLNQVLLFSATLPINIAKMINRYMENPVNVDLSTDRVDVERIENITYRITDAEGTRQQLLVAVLEAEDPGAAIIFCNTKSDTESVTAYLKRRGFDAGLLNSNLSQTAREQVMGRMKEGKHRLLVATDIAARGIDISFLPCVINYEPPFDVQLYIHRTGRTGRVDRKGRAITLLSAADDVEIRKIVAHYNLKIVQEETPTREETLKMLSARRIRQLKERLVHDPVIPDEFRAIAQDIIADGDAERLIALLVDHYLAEAAVEPSSEPRREGHGHPSGARRGGHRPRR